MSETRSFDAPPGDDFVYLAAFQQLVLERSHDLITVIDPRGTIVYASPSWQHLLGWEPETLSAPRAFELLHPDDDARGHARDARRARRRRGRGASRCASVRSDGSWIASRRAARPVRDAEGNVAYLLGTARDVTEREELRDRVGEIDALYRIADAIARTTSLDELFDEAVETLLDATDADRASILLYDDAGVDALPSPGAASPTSTARATEGHSPWTADAVDPRAGARPGRRRRRLRAGRSRLPSCARASARSPSSRSSTHGRLLGKFMLYRDEPHDWLDREVRLCRTIANHLASATVRTRTRTALRDSREQLETIMRTVDEGIIVQSAAGKLVYANESAARVIGFDDRRRASSQPTGKRSSAGSRCSTRSGAPLARRGASGPPRAARRDERARDPLPQQADGRGALVGRPREPVQDDDGAVARP